MHLDGYDLGPALKGEAAWPRKEFIYWTDDGSVAALRYEQLEGHVPEAERPGPQRVAGALRAAARADAANLRMRPVRARRVREAWAINQLVHASACSSLRPRRAYVGQWLQSFKEFPPRQKPGSFNLDRVMEAVTRGAGDK